MPGMEMPKPSSAPAQTPSPAPQAEPARVSQVPATPLNLSEKSKWPEPVADNAPYTYAFFDLLEYQRAGSANVLRWDSLGWRGGDKRRFWLKSEGRLYPGPRTGGGVDVQALYGKLIAPFFDFQVGARVEQRYERGASPTRVFAVVGLQGLAPGRFEIEPALFLSNKGKVSGRFTASVDLLQTQRLILQPRFETEFAAQRDDEFGVERGISDVEVGLRLRYETRREFAPYVGVSYRQSLGATRSRVIREGDAPNELQIVVGVRMWR
jgi:copper resistance protein B